LILTGVAPITRDHLPALRATVPLWALETAHLASLLCGLVLMGVATGLLRRRASARRLALAAAGIGAAAALARGFDVGPAVLGGVLALLLALARPAFYRRGEGPHDALAWATDLGVVAVFVGSVILGLWIYDRAPLEARLLLRMGYHADPARFLRGTAAMGAFILLAGSWRMTRASRPRTPLATEAEIAGVLPLVEALPSTQARLALTGDKALMVAADRSAFLTWAAEGRSLIVMGDPMGAAETGRDLLWRFREYADRIDARPVFYEVGPERLGDYLDLGLGLVKLGEEAHVPLADFSLSGSRRRNLRQTHARAQRDGLTFDLLPPGAPASTMDALAQVSRAWLDARQAREKGFSLGRFDPAVLRRDPIAVARLDGRIVAFANVWTGGGVEASVDLMRHAPDAPHGVMDFLLVELMLRCKADGFERFNLGMAPLSGLAEHPLAPLWHKVGTLVARRGARFYGFEGLRAFKAKFDPVWRPVYLAAPPRQIPAALMDVARLIARPRPEPDAFQDLPPKAA
jgi:phosphatidylglycerol lysyltransferase